jgi:hypothetical protein
MASNEGHIHWSGVPDETINYLGQDLQLTSNVSNMKSTAAGPGDDPIGLIRIRALGFGGTGLALPTDDGWELIPGTSPALEARVDANYAIGYIRVRQQ